MPAKQNRPLLKFVLILIFVGLGMASKNAGYFLRRSLDVKVESLDDLVADCGPPYPARAPYSKGRTWFDGLCGGVMTDHGPFKIVQNGIFGINRARRGEIVAMLKVGCSYHISYYGFGAIPELGSPDSNVVRYTIISAVPIGLCNGPNP